MNYNIETKSDFMNKDIQAYNDAQSTNDREICNILSSEINRYLDKEESKIWHAHPVWFINKNPIVGYSKLKAGIRLMFWSGADFDEKDLKINTGKFKDAAITYTAAEQINLEDVARWIEKSKKIQWDYKNIVKRKGVLIRLNILMIFALIG